ncbi:TolC family protein [Treponema sp. C6A8]|uniref:TolC family protein n=1 Tax=Treponema sp. C6A8 TaxID=1410609 RepID=UPI00048511C8|nr:TolC family protein [Treponema sp. C6A8]
MFRKILTAALICFLSAGLFAQENDNKAVLKLTVDEAVKLALENNVSVKRSELSLKLKKRQKNSSWNSISPTASVSGNFTDDLEKDSYSSSISGSLSVGLSPSIYSSIKSAVLAYEAGELSYEATLRSVELNVRKSFYNILYEKDNLASQERSLETAQQTYDANLSKYNRGQLSELDLLNSQYNVESKKPTITSLRNTYTNDLASFKQILGIGLSIQIELEGNLDEAVSKLEIPESVLNGDLENLPSVKSAQNSVDSAKATLLASRFSAYGPSLTASYSYGKTKVKDVDDLSTSNTLSLGVKIPLDGWLPWSSGALSVASQKENLEELKLKLEDEKTSAAINVRNSYNTILQAESQLETLKKNVQLMQRTFDMTRIAYNNGSKDLLTLQKAEDNLLTAKTSLAQQQFTLISNTLSLESTLGLPFGTFTKSGSEN